MTQYQTDPKSVVKFLQLRTPKWAFKVFHNDEGTESLLDDIDPTWELDILDSLLYYFGFVTDTVPALETNGNGFNVIYGKNDFPFLSDYDPEYEKDIIDCFQAYFRHTSIEVPIIRIRHDGFTFEHKLASSNDKADSNPNAEVAAN